MAYRLPPLNTLRLFEAAGRHLSFKAAAEELHLTPSAVSHGIQTLEGWLGVELFLRGNRSLSLTPAGSAYLPRVRDALHGLALATESVPDVAARISSPADLAALPLLYVANVSDDWTAWAEAAGLPASTLGGGLRFDTLHMATNAAAQGLGIAIGRRPTIDPDLESGRLVEVLGPRARARAAWWLVCAPESLRRPEIAAFRAWMRAEFG